ncbi:MAG: glutamate--cysteine ligase [Legionellales bacterium]|nr:glutamate--cysteine ligase [Legionellales bacterium]
MPSFEIPVPHLTTAHSGPLHPVEEVLLNEVTRIEAWFRKQWQKTPAPITSSVDLRHAGFKLAPVDTNLFPAGYNNLNPEFLPLCIQAAQSTLVGDFPGCLNILLLPESHTRNAYYMSSLSVLRDIFAKAGFDVRVGSLDAELTSSKEFMVNTNDSIRIEPIQRKGNRLQLADFQPCLLLLNNDLSNGIPDVLNGIEQRILPTPKLGWNSRLKSSHFQFYSEVASEFAALVKMDSWLIDPMFSAVDDMDFMAQTGVDELAQKVDELLAKIREKYAAYEVSDTPFVVVKADNGTYGMSVMMVQDGAQLLQMNRKQRTRMAASKGGNKVTRVLIQEGVYSFESMLDGSVAEPVVYMIGPFVVGGFYRVHQGRGTDENLNTPGMHFEPLAFAHACNVPCRDLRVVDMPNRFYAYGVIARLASLAAARETAALVEV